MFTPRNCAAIPVKQLRVYIYVEHAEDDASIPEVLPVRLDLSACQGAYSDQLPRFSFLFPELN